MGKTSQPRMCLTAIRLVHGGGPGKKEEAVESPVAPLANMSRNLFGGAKERFGEAGKMLSSAPAATTSTSTATATVGDMQPATDKESKVKASSKETPVNEDGSRILYKGQQELVVRMLFGASTFNFAYWTYYVTEAWYYEGVVMHGFEMGGDIRWGALGMFATGLMFYATKTFKDNAALMVYLVEAAPGSGQSNRLGFQMHNFFGGPGRRVEANVGNVRILQENDQKAGRFGSSFIPLRVKGMGKNVLIDDKGNFFYDNELRNLLYEQQTLSPKLVMNSENEEEYFPGDIDTKQIRMAKNKHRIAASKQKHENKRR